jgi:hypothetical protein
MLKVWCVKHMDSRANSAGAQQQQRLCALRLTDSCGHTRRTPSHTLLAGTPGLPGHSAAHSNGSPPWTGSTLVTPSHFFPPCMHRCVSETPEARPTAAQLVSELAALEDVARLESARESQDQAGLSGRASRQGSSPAPGTGSSEFCESVCVLNKTLGTPLPIAQLYIMGTLGMTSD